MITKTAHGFMLSEKDEIWWGNVWARATFHVAVATLIKGWRHMHTIKFSYHTTRLAALL